MSIAGSTSTRTSSTATLSGATTTWYCSLQAPTMDRINVVVEKEISTMPGGRGYPPRRRDAGVRRECDQHHGTRRQGARQGQGRERWPRHSQAARTRVSSYVMLEVEKERWKGSIPPSTSTIRWSTATTRTAVQYGAADEGNELQRDREHHPGQVQDDGRRLRIKEYPIITLFES